MTELEERCLQAILAQVRQQNGRRDILLMELPVKGCDQRNQVAYSLEAQGYISHFQPAGRDKIGCHVEDKAMQYAEAEQQRSAEDE